MALAIASSVLVSPGSGNPGNYTYTNAAGAVLVLAIARDGDTAYPTITSITDTAGLTWKRRSITQMKSVYTGAATQFQSLEVWWAFASAAHGSAVTVSINWNTTGVTTPGNPIGVHFNVSGSTTGSAPWDNNAAAYSGQSYSNASVLSGATLTSSTTLTQTNDMIISAIIEETSSGASSVASAGGTQINTLTRGVSPNQWHTASERTVQAASGAASITWTNTAKLARMVMSDALSGTSTGSSADFTNTSTGTITTTLTKTAISAAAKETFTGTIATARTKATMSAAGWTNVTGTVATNLTKQSHTVTGAAIQTTGAIVTRLSKPSQTVTAAEKFIVNTATTSLRALSQAGAGWTTVRGTMVTALRGISQLSQASEIFTGTIQTNLDTGASVAMVATTFELFIGHITTTLKPANIAVIAEEDFIGHVVTRLGNSSGKMTATVIQALEILEGPIVTALPPFRSLMLGAQLGTPGDGKWFSWRYTDA